MKQLILSKLKNLEIKNMSVLAASLQCHLGLPKFDGITNITRLTRARLNVKTVRLPSLPSRTWVYIDLVCSQITRNLKILENFRTRCNVAEQSEEEENGEEDDTKTS